MKYLFLMLFCFPILADTAFLGACQARVTELREATGGLSCPTYKQDCISGTDSNPPDSPLICDGSPCATYVLSVFAGQGNCNGAARCCVTPPTYVQDNSCVAYCAAPAGPWCPGVTCSNLQWNSCPCC